MLGRFSRYAEQRWDFLTIVHHVRDSRPRPQIPASSIFLSVFGMFAVRQKSFNELELQFRIPDRWNTFVQGRPPSADTLAYALERFDLEPLREGLAQVAHQAKRKKAFRRIRKGSRNPYWSAALDGHESGASYKRCCDQCLTREIETTQGLKIQYYHREVQLQLVGVTPALTLDLEPVLPGEDEVAAAIRIVRRIRKRYPRFIDLLTIDAAYLEAPFTRAVLEEGLDVVTVLKQENRDLYQDVEGLVKGAPVPEVITDGERSIQQWDFEDLTSWPQMGRSVRVVCQSEQITRRVRVARQWKQETVPSEWRWMTTLSQAQAQPEWIAEAGHARWDIENRGFNELEQHWAMNHSFHHHPNARLAILLILALAFALTTFFFDRNLKPPIRKGKTRLFLAHRLLEDLILHPEMSFWSLPP